MAGDILSEGFETTKPTNDGYDDADWTEEVGTGCTIETDSAAVARPSGGGDQLLQMISAASGFYTRTSNDLGGAQNITYVSFYHQVTAENLATWEAFVVAEAESGDFEVPWRIYFYQDGSDDLRYQLYIWHDDTENTYEGDDILSLDTWYKVEVKWDVTGDTWEWRVDEATQDSGVLTSTHPTGMAKLYLGDRWGGKTYTMYYDLVEIDSTGYPAGGEVSALEINVGEE